MTNRSFLAALAVSAAAIPACAIAQQAMQPVLPTPKISAASSTTVPFTLFRGNRVVVAARINGTPVEALLDTGASATTLDRAYARSIGLPEGRSVEGRGAGGPVKAELVENVTLEIGGMKFEGMAVAVMDLQPVAKQLGRPLPIIVGRELFNNAAIGFDWDAGRMQVTPSAQFAPPAGAVAVPVERRGPFNYVKVSAAGLPPISAVLDLGNGGAVILPSDYWGKQPRLANLPYAESQSGGVGGLHTTRVVTLPTVEFAGRRFERVPAVLGPDSQGGEAAHDANVGIGMLKQFDLTLDLGRDRIFVKPRAKHAEFDRDRAGLRTQFAGDRLKVTFVSAQGPAAAAGLKVGDEIVAIDGQPITASYYERPEWSRGAPGTQVVLSKADGSRLRVALKDYF